MYRDKCTLPQVDQALPGRDQEMSVTNNHAVLNHPIKPPLPEGAEQALFGMGCFWGAEKLFWQLPGVWSTAVGYSAGITPNATYYEVCTGQTGHNEVVWVAYDTAETTYEAMLKAFWEGHNPTQLNQQGNDVGTQYRSAIYTYSEAQLQIAQDSLKKYQADLQTSGMDKIHTEVQAASSFYYAEDPHQQYLHKNPAGYCGLGGTGVSCSL
ncbi:MAG: peptide-methionine (S)-S-oxide reductase [Saprospiraceae bacterium]|jgi:peptide-methionine (S)-S-oxide reductase